MLLPWAAAQGSFQGYERYVFNVVRAVQHFVSSA
jgi:hypothetical protein